MKLIHSTFCKVIIWPEDIERALVFCSPYQFYPFKMQDNQHSHFKSAFHFLCLPEVVIAALEQSHLSVLIIVFYY